MEIKEIKKKVKNFMDDNCMSQKKLAEKAGIQQSKISYLVNERCKRLTPPIKILVDYIDAKNTSSDARIPKEIEEKIKILLSKDPYIEEPLSEIISNLHTIIRKE